LSAFGSKAYTRCAVGGERGQSSFAAADFEHALALEWDERGDGAASTPSSSRLLHSLSLRLVGLDGGAAGAELLRFAARVFELGAGVGVDELAGLDPLEAVTL
jgi:hypothetical protein